MMATRPDLTAKIREELDTVLGPDPNAKIDSENSGRLLYLTAFIKEVMRMHPVSPEFARRLTADAVIGGYNIPKGTTLLLATIAQHHDPQIWDQPTVFNPDRFFHSANKDAAGTSRVYFPFGYGKRTCIGQNFALLEMRLILATLIRNFNFALLPMEPLTVEHKIIYRPKRGLRMTVWPFQRLSRTGSPYEEVLSVNVCFFDKYSAVISLVTGSP